MFNQPKRNPSYKAGPAAGHNSPRKTQASFALASCVVVLFSLSHARKTWAAVIEGGSTKADTSNVKVVTRVVGQVDTHFITSREVRIDDAIDQALDASPVEYQDALKDQDAETGSKRDSKKAKRGELAAKTAATKNSDSDKASSAPTAATHADEGATTASKNLLRRSSGGAGSNFVGKLLTGDEKTFPNNVSRALDEWMISLEAESLQANPPIPADISAGVKRVSEFWGNRPAWRALEVSGEELKRMVARKLLARNFEDFKNNVATAPVSDTDALSYYQRNHSRFGNLPFSTFKDNIKSFLTRQQMEVRMNEWLEVLRRKYKVRNFIAG